MITRYYKALLLIVMMTAFATSSLAQQTVEFNYDANGNRILRQIEVGGGKNEKGEIKNIQPATDNFETFSITLYPNPTEGQFSISIDGSSSTTELRATLTTTTGEIISDKVCCNPTEDFDLTAQPAGIYLLQLINGNECHIWKIIKK